MIYGEESAKVDFSNGLWISDTPDIPDGFVRELKNLQLDNLGALSVRSSILAAYTAMDPNGQTLIGPGGRDQIYSANGMIHGSHLGNVNALDANKHPTYVEPNQWENVSTTPYKLGTIHPDGSAVRTQTLTEVPGSNLVQYFDRVYVWTYNDGIKRLLTWSPPGAFAVPETNIAGSPGLPSVISGLYPVSVLLVHKDRLFLFNRGGRVYFTDTAPPGGYPETWDVAANFFIVPAREILHAFVKDDDVYIWTTKGVWILQVYGPPESWILKNISSDISVQDPCQVALNHGVFYYIDNKTVMAFNGQSAPTDISKPVQTYLDKCHGMGVFQFEKGVIVCGEIHGTMEFSPGVFNTYVQSTKLLYFDSENGGWTEIVISGQTAPVVTGSFSDVWSPISDNRPTTYLTLFLKTNQYVNSYKQQTLYLSRLDTCGDSVLKANPPVLPIDFSVETNHFVGNSHKEKRIKMGYAKMHTTLTTVDISTTVDGKEVDDTQNLKFDNLAVDDGYYHQALSMPGFARRISVSVNGTVPAAAYGVPITVSPFDLTDITLIYNTGRNEERSSSG